jgi:hypothetical protein
MAPSSKSRWLVLPAYLMLGLGLGVADPWLGQIALTLGIKPGTATALSVNLLLPLAAAVFGFRHARVAIANAGAIVITAGFIAGLAVCYPPVGQGWSPASLLRSVPPVLVIAAFGYLIIGSAAALAGQARQRPQHGAAFTPD